MIFLAAIVLIAVLVAANIWGWVWALALCVIALVVFFLVVQVASFQAEKKFAHDNRDLSGEAERIAVFHGLYVDGIDASEKFSQQGRELYDYFRRKGLTSDEAIDAVKERYERELDDFEHKRVAGIAER